MPFTLKKYDQLVADQKQEMANLNPELSLQSDDDEIVRARGVAVVVEGAYQHQAWVIKQLFPQTAEKQYLDFHAEKAGLTRKPAVAATGTIEISGDEDAELPIGAAIVRNGYTWLVTSLGTIDDEGTATVNAIATTTGPEGNLAADTPVTIAAAPAGIESAAIALVMSGGKVQETDEELRDRVLFALQNPEGNGTVADLRRWATAVPGVARVYIYRRRRGLGTADLCITSSSGLPSGDLIDDVQAIIASQNSEPADNVAYAPTLKNVDFDISVALQGITLAVIKPIIEGLLEDYFDTLNPADKVYVKQLEALIMGLKGVVDVSINTPAANVVPVVDIFTTEWCRLGNVEVNDLL